MKRGNADPGSDAGIPADQRQALEHLCRYITRPAIANERLSVNLAVAGSWRIAGTD